MLNRGYTYTEIADDRGGSRTLSAYLASRHAHTSEAAWRERIAGGRVLVNGRRVGADELLQAGWTVTWLRPPWHEQDVPLEYGVLHEDDDLIAVAKPAGLPTLPGGGFLENTLLARVRLRYPGASPVHRLGRGTSGIVVFARTSAAASALARAWREKRVTKVYRALVAGIPARDTFVVDTPIGPAISGTCSTRCAWPFPIRPRTASSRCIASRRPPLCIEASGGHDPGPAERPQPLRMASAARAPGMPVRPPPGCPPAPHRNSPWIGVL